MNAKILLAVLLALAVGALVLLRWAPAEAAESGSAPDPQLAAGLAADLAELARTQERTLRVLEALEARLAANELVPPAGLAAPRESADGAPAPGPAVADLGALAQSIDALRVTFQAETQRTQELLRSAPALGGESLIDVRARRSEIDWVALELLEERWNEDERASDRSQYFQSARDLIEAYGPPSAIYRPKGGVLFVYRRADPSVPANSWYFRLQDDYVVEFWIEIEGGEEESD